MKTADSNSSLDREHVEAMDNHNFRAILVKLQDRLSDDDRKRLHFYLGNDVPRRIRDDPTLGGSLCLLESLFDQDKINEQDFTFLIHAFDEIQCHDAVKLLRAHMKRIQSSDINQSVQSLSVLMPSLADQIIRDQPDEDSVHTKLVDQNMDINKNVKDNSLPVAVNNPKKSLLLKQKELFKLSSIAQKCFLVFFLLSIILLGIVMGFSAWIIHLKAKHTVLNEHAKNNETIHFMKLSQTRFHEIIEDLMNKMRQVMLKRLREIEKGCIKKSNLDPEASPISPDLYPTFVEDLACLKACYKCIDERLSSSRKKRASDKCGALCDCADSCSNTPIVQINKIYSQSNYTSDKSCFWNTYTQSVEDDDTFSLTLKKTNPFNYFLFS